jgi:hypothetical protein
MAWLLDKGPFRSLSEANGTAPGDFTVPTLFRVNVPVRGLDRRLDGLRVGQLSDVHLGPFQRLEYLERALRLFGRHPPEILAVTGDLLDREDWTVPALDIISRVRAPLGRFYVMGNHENYAGRQEIMAAARAHRGVRFLWRESVEVRVGGARVRVLGMDYPPGNQPMEFFFRRRPIPHFFYQRRFPDADREVTEVTQGTEDADFRLCLVHHPDYFDQLRHLPVELTLAGHTHGGQVDPVGTFFARAAFRYVLGHYESGGRHLYVNGGTGHNFPVRVNVHAEVTELTLRRA